MSNYKEEDEEQIEVSTYAEGLLISILRGYEDAFNKTNDKYNIKFTLTITNHKQATPDGNKDLAYLRIERGVKEKEDKEGEWPMTMVVRDMYIFKDLQERLNSKAPWKEQLYVNVIAKLVAGGVEYAELLKRTQAAREESRDRKSVV